MRRLFLFPVLFGAPAAYAADTITYSYDVLGRLVTSSTSGGPADKVSVTTTFDPAGNRKNQRITRGGGGTPTPTPTPTSTCSFTASPDRDGSDEFSLYPAITRSGTCAGPVTLAYSVTLVSGSGTYGIYGGPTLDTVIPASGTVAPFDPANAGDTYRSLRLSAWKDTVNPGDNLIFDVRWSVASGSATITDADTRIMFCDDGAGC